MMSNLPNNCLSINDVTGELIRIVRGQKGFCLERDGETGQPVTGERAKQLRDAYNEKFGITKPQERAMAAGSMFGFDAPVADPECPLNQDEQDECPVDADGCLVNNDGDAETDMEDRG
jgi:hypothetical protein